MSVVEDVRQVLQDFLAPELRALSAKIDAIDQKVSSLESRIDSQSDKTDSRFQSMDNHFQSVEAKLHTVSSRLETLEATTQLRFERAEEKAAARQEAIMIQFESMRNQLNLDGRLRRIEDREAARSLAEPA
jgi:phage shock protein A